jgi:hypothetical protein
MTRCVDCGVKTNNLVKCSKEGCDNQLCSKCADRYRDKHCNGCYVGGRVEMAEWVFTGDNPPNTVPIDLP